MRLTLCLASLLFSSSLFGQVVVDSIYFNDNHYFDPMSTTCDKIETKRDTLNANYQRHLKQAQATVDSLNEADYPCFEYALKTYFLQYFEGYDMARQLNCALPFKKEGYSPHEFAILIHKARRDRSQDDPESQKEDCD